MSSFYRSPEDVFLSSVCAYVPPRKLSNIELLKAMGHDRGLQSKASWIEANTGIEFRHWVEETESTADLAYEAVEKFFHQEKAISKGSVDKLILSTISGDYSSPPTAPLVQHRCGLKSSSILDMGAACAGFCAGITNAVAFVNLGTKNQLVVCADIRSKFLNANDLRSFSLFGDAAAVALVSSESDNARYKFLGAFESADGSVADIVSVPAGGSHQPYSENPEDYTIRMKSGMELLLKAASAMAQGSRVLLDQLSVKIEDVDYFVPHQGNKHLVEQSAKLLGIPLEKTIQSIARYGNTSGSSVGLALGDAQEENMFQSGQKILVSSAGGGGISSHMLLEVL